MKFFCVKGKHSFETETFTKKQIKGRNFAIARCSTHGIDCYRITKD